MDMTRQETGGKWAPKDLRGQVFGLLTAVERAGVNQWGYSMWRCTCACGNEKDVSAQVLLKTARGQRGTKSCGCMQRGRPCESGSAILNSLFLSRRASANKRGYEWNLTREQAFGLFAKPCVYCGAAPFQLYRLAQCKDDALYSGLDRKDNSKGYTLDNVVPCCGRCNTAKHDRSIAEFRDWARRIVDRIEHWPA